MKRPIINFLLMLIMSASQAPVNAEDKALLIGVGEYKESFASDLPGIDLDIDIMRRVTSLMGYKQSNVKVLLDEQATLSNVEEMMGSWLVKGTAKDDRIFIYFSGHGTRIPDESGDETLDGEDEVLVMHDARPVRRNGKDTLANVFVDDKINQWLNKIPSNNITLVVDACNSGTVNKSIKFKTRGLGEDKGERKFLTYAGMPLKGSAGLSFTNEGTALKSVDGEQGRYIGLSAAQDNEYAIATEAGSVFSLGIQENLQRAKSQGKAITATALIKQVESYIQHKVKEDEIFRPNLTGDAELAKLNLLAVARSPNAEPAPNEPTTPGNGHYVWEQMASLADDYPGLAFTTDTPDYEQGDPITLSIKVPSAGGYLNVISVDSRDRATVLFPNSYHKSNRVPAGQFIFPARDMGFTYAAQAPFGKTLFVAIITEKPLNLFEMGLGKRNDVGEIQNTFARLSPKGMKGVRVVAGQSRESGRQIIAGRVIATVKP